MIHIDKMRAQAAAVSHFEAVLNYIKSEEADEQKKLFEHIVKIPMYKAKYGSKSFQQWITEDDWGWMKEFLLADVDNIRKMAENYQDKLQFTYFRDMYKNYFSKSPDIFVDKKSQYNAYAFVKNLDIFVCPYCEDEYIETLILENGKQRRTVEVDHFFPKDKYPGLAMCFYNLIPSGHSCNSIKNDHVIGKNPYEEDIESCTHLYPDLPVGINMESVTPDQCTIEFHPKNGMEKNVAEFGLKQRYQKHKYLAHQYLKDMQQLSPEMVAKLVEIGMYKSEQEVYERHFGPFDPDVKKKMLQQKLKKDITGF